MIPCRYGTTVLKMMKKILCAALAVMFQFLIGTVQQKFLLLKSQRKKILWNVSIPHRYGTTTDFIRSLVFIILLFPRFSTVLAKKVGLPRARNTLFPAFFKMVGGRPTFSLFLAQNQLFFYQKMPRNLYFTRKIADRLFYPIYQKKERETAFTAVSLVLCVLCCLAKLPFYFCRINWRKYHKWCLFR